MNAQLTNRDVAQLITTWKVLFGSKLQSDHWDINTIKIWTVALNDLEITPEEFATAQRKSLTLEWPPTAPADFLKLGRVDVTESYPEVSQAYEDQANFKTDCPIAYETAKRVGFWQMRNEPRSKTYPQWVKRYKQVCIEHRGGKEFTKSQVPQIEYKEPHRADEEAAAKAIQNIKALLSGGEK